MHRYLNNAILCDLALCILIGGCLFVGKPYLVGHVSIPTVEGIDKLGDALITVCATLIGFLLTIITVIVTFKKGFEDKMEGIDGKQEKVVNPSEIPSVTVFDNNITKEKQFYGTDLHKKVADIFIGATYEAGLILFLLLSLKLRIFPLSKFWFSLLTFLPFILLGLAVIRSFYIFQLFLKVHLHDKKINCP